MATTHEDLPDECWELILNKLHPQHHSLLEAPSLTCKRFLYITNALRTHLTIVVPALFLPLPTLLDRFPNLTSIDVIPAPFSGGDFRRLITVIATSNLNLQTLDFRLTDGLPLESWRLLGSCMNNMRVLVCRGLRTLTDNELAVIADSMPCLEDLDISYPLNDLWSDHELQGRSRGDVAVTDSGIEVLSSKLKSLRKINVFGNDFLTDKSLFALSTNCVYLTDIVAKICVSITLEGIQFVMRNSSNLSLLSIDGIQFGSLDDSSICCARKLSTLEIHDSVVPDGYLHLLEKADIPLKSFTLSYCIVTFSGISSVLKKYSSLESLSLHGIHELITDEKMSDLSQYLSALVKIELVHCDNLTAFTLFKLARNCPLLKDISMVGTNLGGGGDGAIDIVQNPQIKSLILENNRNLSDECLAKLASVCPNLEVLLVPSCKRITENGIAEFLKSCSNSKVRSLRIDGCGLIKSIGNGFELPQLDFLGATRSGIDDDGLVVIANRCRELRNLNLAGCLEVTTVGLKEILTNCEKLREINLTGCLHVRAETIDWMVFSRPSLRKIILSEASLPSESQRKLFLRHGCHVFSEQAGWECLFLP